MSIYQKTLSVVYACAFVTLAWTLTQPDPAKPAPTAQATKPLSQLCGSCRYINRSKK